MCIRDRFARENNIPLLGICLGMQIMTIEFARNVLGLKDANSSEFDLTTKNPVISIMEEQKNVVEKGGTMRLGAWKCQLKPNSKLLEIYGNKNISERHRHRYEFNSEYLEDFEKNGIQASGVNPDTKLVETIAVSYTHLDVYKRQCLLFPGWASLHPFAEKEVPFSKPPSPVGLIKVTVCEKEYIPNKSAAIREYSFFIVVVCISKIIIYFK